MSSLPPAVVYLKPFASALRTYWMWWVVPVVAMTVGSLGFALTKGDSWQATQALHLRNVAAGTQREPGSFGSLDEMKTAQETLLELVLNQSALASALSEVGPAVAGRGGEWPGPADIDALRDSISIKAPGGAEFGSTEVIQVSVKSNSRERAVALTEAVCNQLEKNLQALREKRTDSIIQEFTKSLQLAKADLSGVTKKMEDLEAEVGPDLHELRVLNQSSTGDSNLRTSLNNLKNELRAARTAFEDKSEQLKHVVTARSDSSKIVALPSRLLESQPSLKKLKDGLIEAQLRRAELEGVLSKDHPKMQAAVTAENEVLADLHRELEVAQRGLSADVAITKTLMQSLETQRADVENRLNRLSVLRVRYGNLDAEVKQRSEIVQKATKDLADAKGSRAAGRAASLITRIDGPQLGTNPLGPGRTTICAAGLFGGLIAGMGLVFLVSPLGQATGRRWSDSVIRFGRRASDMLAGAGRRKSDLAGGKRLGDPPAAGETLNQGKRAGDATVTASSASGDRRSNSDRRKGSA